MSGEVWSDGVEKIYFKPEKLERAGRYEVRVVARDKAGNETREEVPFDYQPPPVQLSSADPEGDSYLRDLEVIKLSFSEGCDLIETGRRVTLRGPKGEVPVRVEVEGDKLLVHLARALLKDGSDDGEYVLEVVPVDSYGNEGVKVELRYIYDTREPEVESVSYIADVADELRVNYLNAPFDRLEARGRDELSGLDFEKSYLKLLKLEGDQEKEIEGQLGNDGSGRMWLILSRPLAADGSDDGEYRVKVKLVDKAGNSVERTYTLLYDTIAPEATIEGLEEIYELTPPSEATVRVTDEGSGPDLSGTVVKLVGPEGEVPVDLENNGVDLITVHLPELKAEGSYRLEVIPKDKAGNSPKNPVQFTFYLVVAPPTVSSASTIVEVRQLSAFGLNYVNSLEGLLITLKGADVSPVDSKIEVYGPTGQIPGEIEVVETNRAEGWVKVKWTPRMPIARDGSADGSYTVKVTPVDKLGRAGEPVEFRLVYDTQKPVIASITHIDPTSPVSYLNRSIDRMEVAFADEGPSGIDIEGCSFEMFDPSGKPVPGSLTDDGKEKLFWTPESPMATDGSMDGRYVIRVKAVDKAGNALERSFTLIYDTIAPTVEFVEPKGELVTGTLTQVIAKFIDPEPGVIDFDASYLKLFDPEGREIEGKLSNDGVSTVKLVFSNPEEEGTYTIKAMAVDKAGNGMGVTFEKQFNYSTGLPVVVSTFPKTSPPEEAYTNQQITKVEAVLRETNNGGISFLSQIRLIDPNGNLVPGSQSDNGVDTIIWNLSKPLATDGSDDGLYTITVVPINASGRRGDQLRFTFFYDTVPPEVDLDTLQLITSQTAQNALSEISVVVRDEQPSSGIDWDEVDESWIKLIGPDGKPVPGEATSDKAEKLIFKLEVPLATDGSQDGRYKIVIAPKDKAGNVGGPVEYEFYYDTTPPVIDPSSLTINGKPLELDPNSPDYPTAVSTQSGVTIVARMTDEGAGVDLTRSSIQIFGPKGEPISGTLKQNGVDTLEFRSDMLPEEGIYKVMIKAVGLDAEGLGISPETSISTSFLFEMTKPVARLTEHGPRTSYENEPAPLRGTASDPPGENVPASGVALVEIGGYGPDGEELEWVPAEDESAENEEPWSKWSFDFLPPKSGKYELKIRVTDRAGNYEIYDAVELEFNVSLTFKGPVFAWPNPVSRSRGDVAHFSFELNLAPDERAEVVISIYDVGGDLVWRSDGLTAEPGRNEGELMTWNLRNQFGERVVPGIYIFRIEATRGDQKAVATGTILVVR
ncbi:hypothetical protein DRP77_06150 [Candidatus Poribacteria bacterium]|nr:MAG: hypothetical protein DRP77_06150 [Candidatus Poribacteria bacterium]